MNDHSRPANQRAFGPSSPPELSARDIIAGLFKHRRVVTCFFVVVVGTVALATFLATATYEASAAFLVKQTRAEVLLAPTESTRLVVSQVTEEDLNSEVEILRSRQLIEDVLIELGIDERATPEPDQAGLLSGIGSALKSILGASELSYFDKTVREVEEELTAEVIRGSNVVETNYRSDDPEWAALFLRTLTEQYLERRTRIYQVAQAVAFFDEETSTARSRLTDSENALEEFLRVSGVSIPIDAQKQAVLNTLSTFEQQLSESQMAVRVAEETVAALEERLAAEPERLPSADRFNLDPEVEEIQKRLVTLRLDRDALIQDYGRDNRKVRDIEEQIRLAEEFLQRSEARLGDINRTEVNPVHQNLRAQLLSGQAELEGARAQHAALGVHVAEFRGDLNDLDQKGFEVERLEREIRVAEEAYLLYSQKQEEARISAAMDRQKMVNVSIAREAEVPLVPVAPRKRLNMTLALLLGAIGGVGVALGREAFDHSLSTPEDIERDLGLAHLASIPEGRH